MLDLAKRKEASLWTGNGSRPVVSPATGKIPPSHRLWLQCRLQEAIASLADRGVDTFLAGGALGFDTLAAQEVLRLRAAELPQLRLVLVLPCLGQEAYWKPEDAALYQDLLRQADEAIYTADTYSRWCMFQRDRYLVDHSAYCLCYWNRAQGERGGTAYTVGYARKRGLEVENLGDFPLLNR